jgi:hypothetical protein
VSDIDTVLKEGRVFPPPPAFQKAAHLKSIEDYRTIYRRSVEDPESFWAEQAAQLRWSRKWDRVLEWKAPFAKWFEGGKLKWPAIAWAPWRWRARSSRTTRWPRRRWWGDRTR